MLCGILAKSFSSDLALGQGPRGAEARDAFAGVTHNENLIDFALLTSSAASIILTDISAFGKHLFGHRSAFWFPVMAVHGLDPGIDPAIHRNIKF